MHNGGGDSFKIGNFCTFQTSMTLTLDWVIWHTVMYHLLTSTYMPNFVLIGKHFVDGQEDGQ